MPSAMLTSVPVKLKGSKNFETYYNNLCALQDTVPVQSVKAHLAEGALDINADRIRLPDWGPILNSIRINKSLSFIGIRSYFQQTKEKDDALGRPGVRRRSPAVRSKEVVNRLCLALKECLLNSSTLQYLEVQGIPLKEKDITNLAKGLSRASALEHLSLEGCRLSNKAMSVLCHNIRNSTSLVSLNLTGCGLTCNAAQSIAKVVKHQSTRRHSEAWKESLRYRRPDLDRMAGIRRITLNTNPLLNDEGAAALADAIRDDLWLKALDLQHCGLSNTGAQVLLNALHENSTVVVLDLRKNALIDHELVKAVIEQVMINGGGHESEYKWLRSSESTEKPTRRKVKHVSKVANKKSSKQMSTVRVSRSRMRSKSADGRLAGKTEEVPVVRRPGPGFVPWRTAARAVSRGASAERGKNDSDLSTPTKDLQGVHFHLTTTTSTPTCSDTSVKDTSSYVPERRHDSTSKWMERTRDEKGKEDKEMRTRDEKRKEDKEMRVELEEIRRRHYVESQARSAADAHIVELEVENSRLRHEIQMLQARGASSPFKKQAAPRPDGLGELDEGVLDSIEESFRKFHTFLDLLRDAGLGQLCTLIGLSPGDIKNPSVASILRDHQPTPMSKSTAEHHQQEHTIHQDDSMPSMHHDVTQPVGYRGSIPTQSQPTNGEPLATDSQPYTAQPVPIGWGDHVPTTVGWAPPPVGFAAQLPSGFAQPLPGSAQPQPQGNILQPLGWTPQPQGNIPQPSGWTPQSQGNIPQPIGWTPQPQGNIPQPTGWTPQGNIPQPAGWTPQPGFVPPHNASNMHYTQSSVGYHPQLAPKNQGIMFPPQNRIVHPAHHGHTFDESSTNVGHIHITAPAQTQDILHHVDISRSRDTPSPEGQEATEAQQFQNLVESGVATMPRSSTAYGSIPLQPDVDSKKSIIKQITINGLSDNKVMLENDNITEPGLLELHGEDLVIKDGKTNKPVTDYPEDIHAVNKIDNTSSGPRGDANLPPSDFRTATSPDRTPEPSPDRTPELSPERTPSPVYSDSWASGSSKLSNVNSESIHSTERKSDGENVRSEKLGKQIDLASDRSSPLDIVEELLDYSSDNEF